MAGTNAAAVKARLCGTGNVLENLSGMTGVEVVYDPGQTIDRELVYIAGDVAGPMELAAMRAGTRLKRSEDLTLTLVVHVHKKGEATRAATDARAVAVGAIIENYLAANPRLASAANPVLSDLANLKLAKVSAVNLGGWLEDESATSTLSYTISLESFLT